MKSFLLFVLFVIVVSTSTSQATQAVESVDLEVNAAGDAISAESTLLGHDSEGVVAEESDSSSSSSKDTSVKVINFYFHDIKLYYVGKNAVEFFMDLIVSGEEYYMNTFVGHSFYVKDMDDSFLSSFIIVRGQRLIELAPKNKAEITLGEEPSQQRMHPSIMHIPGKRTLATAIIFRSLSTRRLQIWWDNKTPTGSYSGDFLPGGQSTTNAYIGHIFFFTDAADATKRIATVEITAERVLYVIRDDVEHTVSTDLILKVEKEEQFMKEYRERTGIHWRHFYGKNGPRPPPILHMWPTTALGLTHHVESTNGHWSCLESGCQSASKVPLDLEVVSIAPKVFIISKFLNAFEADHIISLAKNSIKESKVGDSITGYASTTRTSKNSWIPRSKDAIIDTLYRRAADALNVDEAFLTINAEEIQVVHYEDNQKYEAHHDWGAALSHGSSRFITMLMYLTDQEVPSNGGETAFPKGGTGGGFKVKPVKGDAVLFYNLLEDGNGDDLALHAALPVTSGEKWLANFWVWDPIKTAKD